MSAYTTATLFLTLEDLQVIDIQTFGRKRNYRYNY